MKLSTIGWIALGLLVVFLTGGWFMRDTILLHWEGWRAPKVGPTRTVNWKQGPAQPMAAVNERAPNIVLIVVDDLGLNDISLNGGGRGAGTVLTPHIDAIAREGVVMETAYAAHARSGPSRAALMTGRYPTRFGYEFEPVPAVMGRVVAQQTRRDEVPWIYRRDRARSGVKTQDMGVPDSEVTLAELLAGRGYHTVHLGQWGMGAGKGMRPEQQGFDESLGFMGSAQKYAATGSADIVAAKRDFDPAERFERTNLAYGVQYNGGAPFRPDGYMTDYLSDQAVRVIEANRNRSFFLYMAYNAPRTPLQALKSDYDQLAQIKDPNERVYAAMIVALDRGVGRIMQALKDQGLDENTLVIFASDNGASNNVGVEGLNAPYRGWNRTFFEGGVRVPFFARWPKHYAAGTRISQPVSLMDIYATSAAVSAARLPSDRVIDGVDLTPFITQALPNSVHEALFWRNGSYRAVRSGQWKLQLQSNPRRAWLYDLKNDPSEQTNLAQQRPEIVDYLTTRIQLHDQQQVQALWPGLLLSPVGLDKTAAQKLSPTDPRIDWMN